MDDLALLDLLECPVCFEKLDATAKVLPCQHTFCKPCLQRILKSQKELRCPECRTLVLCSIDQLPSNLLLIRLLDGVRCGQNVTRFGSIQRSGVLSSPASIRRIPRGLQLHQHRLATNPRIHMDGNKELLLQFWCHLVQETASLLVTGYCPRVHGVSHWPEFVMFPLEGREEADSHAALQCARLDVAGVLRQVPRARALYTYRGHNPGELRFNKGDIIVLLRQLDENWYLGEVNGISGVFPASSVQVIKHLPLPQPLGRALYSLDLRGRDKAENKDSLTFHKPNTTARQLLQTSKTHWSPQFKSASLRTASPKAKGADSPAFPKVPDSRRKSLRQFSITTALNTLNRMVHAPAERPALEISSPVLISSSNPTVATQSSEKAEFTYSTPVQVSTSYYPAPGPLGPSAAIVTLPHLQHHVPAYLCVALHSYVPHGPDELELQKGEGVRVFGKDHDGWLRGMSLVTGRVGIFPSNYVAPLFRGGESRTPSVCSSVILDAKDPPVKSEAAPKPPASAPPSILVKPETCRNSAEKQVKTVRFQNHSPPPPKRHSLQPSPRLQRSRTEPEVLLPEAGLGPELLVLYSPRLGSSPLHPRRALHPKALSLDLSGQLTFPVKKSYSSISAN
ncbi:SH3 domain containing ring finger 2 [Pitangus sulphuratus]|nr:SH3 domain containing ring finger 2 [Pitangus sulphuratus]